MAIWLAHKTLDAINRAMCADGGSTYRQNLQQVLPHIGDAYRAEDGGHRSHLGASKIGGDCERALWYSFRWAHKKRPSGKKGEHPDRAESRMLRLWNRGHLEEGRFIALLLMIGVQVYQQDEHGKQYKISAFGGHFGGSGDGILMGVPDLPMGVPALGEFKTHSNKSFTELVDEGVREAKPEHYAQMQTYMHHFGILYALYLAVNKDTDELHAEIVMYDRVVAETMLDKAKRIIFGTGIPRRLPGGSPGFHTCKYLCDMTDVCYSTKKPEKNCRTCDYVDFAEDGTVVCVNAEVTMGGTHVLTKAEQAAGCGFHSYDERFANADRA